MEEVLGVKSPPPMPWLLSVSQFLFRFLFLRLTCALKRIFCTLSSNRWMLHAAALPLTSSFGATKDSVSVRLKSRRIPAATQLTCLLGMVWHVCLTVDTIRRKPPDQFLSPHPGTTHFRDNFAYKNINKIPKINCNEWRKHLLKFLYSRGGPGQTRTERKINFEGENGIKEKLSSRWW